MKILLKQENVWGLIDDTLKKPDEKDPNTTREIEKYKKINTGNALENIYHHVAQDKKQCIVDCETPKESWDKLKQIYEPSSRARKARMRREFLNLKLERSKCYVHIASEKRGKLEDKAWIGVLVGYGMSTRGYRVWDPVTNQVYETKHVKIDEDSIYKDFIDYPPHKTKELTKFPIRESRVQKRNSQALFKPWPKHKRRQNSSDDSFSASSSSEGGANMTITPTVIPIAVPALGAIPKTPLTGRTTNESDSLSSEEEIQCTPRPRPLTVEDGSSLFRTAQKMKKWEDFHWDQQQMRIISVMLFRIWMNLTRPEVEEYLCDKK
uniref:Retroviral polymerase SH3-like domain-containing protein n=1 Tax=Strigamia maritima TaxID=126957 RepID=T1J2C8_STRMM